jgi:putative CocE/NonD family hydrolase
MKALVRTINVFAGLSASCALALTAPLLLAQTTTGPSENPQLSGEREAMEKTLESVATIERKVMVPMRDGVRLSTDIYRPKGMAQQYPTIFVRTPYNNNFWDTQLRAPADMSEIYEWVKRGYAYVFQSERGKYFSEGNWDILGAPRTDGSDAFSWVAAQPWSNGKVGLVGCSSLGEWQMGVAALGNPALAAMIPQGYGAGIGRVRPYYEQGTWYRGGAVMLEMSLFMYEVQNMQRPMFSADLSQEDRVRLAKGYDLEARLPHVNWDEEIKHLPVQDILRNVGGPVGAFADPTPVATGGRMIQRTPDDPAWYKGGLFHDDMQINVPGLWMVSWYDLSAAPNIALFNHLRSTAATEAARNQYLIIAPVLHCKFNKATENTIVGERDVGDARFDYSNLIYGWFDHFLKGENNGLPDSLPRVRYYTMGSNKWQTSDTWPPKNTRLVNYYLHSGGAANALSGDGTLAPQQAKSSPPDTLTYDPTNPVPTLGGHFCCIRSDLAAGAYDQRRIEARHDVLVYTTTPLRQGVEVTGPIGVTLYVSSDRKDTDFTAKLLDVYPDGRAFNLDDTIQRVRYRDGYDKQVWMEEGRVYKVVLGPMVTSNFFAPGHRIRLEVSSSSFPAFDRNLNTGGHNYDEINPMIAHNTVHHSKEFPSSIQLTVVAAQSGTAVR